MQEFKFDHTIEEYAMMIKGFIDEGGHPVQRDIKKRFNNIIPRNKVYEITTDSKYIGKLWNVEKKKPRGYIYVPVEENDAEEDAYNEISIKKHGDEWALRISGKEHILVHEKHASPAICLIEAMKRIM